MNKMNRLLTVSLICLVFILFVLYEKNTYKVGGFAGNLNRSSCLGISIKKTSANFPDAFETYSCIGLIR